MHEYCIYTLKSTNNDFKNRNSKSYKITYSDNFMYKVFAEERLHSMYLCAWGVVLLIS